MQKKREINNGGFTLVELLISITILAIAIIGIGGLYPRSLSVTVQMHQHSRAITLAESKLQELARLPVSDPQLAAGQHGPELIDGRYNRTWFVRRDYPLKASTRVIVAVTWRTLAAVDSVGMTTFLPK